MRLTHVFYYLIYIPNLIGLCGDRSLEALSKLFCLPSPRFVDPLIRAHARLNTDTVSLCGTRCKRTECTGESRRDRLLLRKPHAIRSLICKSGQSGSTRNFSNEPPEAADSECCDAHQDFKFNCRPPMRETLILTNPRG